jgi:hypothetical protein
MVARISNNKRDLSVASMEFPTSLSFIHVCKTLHKERIIGSFVIFSDL